MKKFARIIIEMLSYFFIMLVILLIFKKLGWTNADAVSYAATVTIGWTIGKSIFSAIEKRRAKKRRAAESANIPEFADSKNTSVSDENVDNI